MAGDNHDASYDFIVDLVFFLEYIYLFVVYVVSFVLCTFCGAGYLALEYSTYCIGKAFGGLDSLWKSDDSYRVNSITGNFKAVYEAFGVLLKLA